MMGEISIKLDAKLEIGNNKVAIWQSQRTMNLFNNATSLWVHCEVNVFNKFATRILKLRVLSGLPKMVSFKCEAKMPRHNDEESFINKNIKNRNEENGWINGESSREVQDIVISNYELETKEKKKIPQENLLTTTRVFSRGN